jgi:four helix bundle protein
VAKVPTWHFVQTVRDPGQYIEDKCGAGIAQDRDMGVNRVEDMVAHQFAVEFKLEVYRLIRESPEANRDRKYRMQLADATDGVDANMTEGFRRCHPGELATFLRYALATLAEAETRLRNGILRGYFAAGHCDGALVWARRCRAATQGWHASQRREQERRKSLKKNGTGGREPRGTGGQERRSPGEKGREVRRDKNKEGPDADM